eukprot:SAG31_NODE_2964_length_4844_cov_1.789673_2_plen_101_part_00
MNTFDFSESDSSDDDDFVVSTLGSSAGAVAASPSSPSASAAPDLVFTDSDDSDDDDFVVSTGVQSSVVQRPRAGTAPPGASELEADPVFLEMRATNQSGV